MNKLITRLNGLLLIVSSTFLCLAENEDAQNVNHQEGRRLKLLSEWEAPVIGPDHPDVVSSKNKSGFETGQVVKVGEVYHMFVNEMFGRPHLDMRISHWTSDDAINWKRQSTVVESDPGRTHDNPRAEVWVNGVVFNKKENAWNIFYVAYRAGDSEKGEIEARDYDGRIWRAKSTVPGIDGIAGPYKDIGIVFEKDETTQKWEGQQAVAGFHPYQVGDRWYAFYAGHNHVPRGPWLVGLATSPELAGPWVRLPEEINPLSINERFIENPVVTKLKSGGYLSVHDSYGLHDIGYSLSADGVSWNPDVLISVQSEENRWAKGGNHNMRTPLCAIEEADGTFTVLYTAIIDRKGARFYAIGKCVLAWE